MVVKTSDVKGAGTDANVYLTLFGEMVSPRFDCFEFGIFNADQGCASVADYGI